MTVSMTADTVELLVRCGYVLQVFRAVRSSMAAGRPLLWLRQPDCSPTTHVSWQAGYQAYVSISPIEPGRPVPAGFSIAIEEGQRLRVRDGGIGEVVPGEAGSISFLNLTGRAFTCGVGEGGAPFCAFPLYGGNLLCMTPVARILARWSTGPVPAGTVVGSAVGPPAAYGPGVLVDYAGAGQRDLRYDINGGWSWGGGSWARQVEADRDLVPLLVLGAVPAD